MTLNSVRCARYGAQMSGDAAPAWGPARRVLAAEVAEQVLRSSQVLTDEDLVEIVQSQSCESRVAIAQRDNVPAEVCDALVESADEDAVATMVGNDGARHMAATPPPMITTCARMMPFLSPVARLAYGNRKVK